MTKHFCDVCQKEQTSTNLYHRIYGEQHEPLHRGLRFDVCLECHTLIKSTIKSMLKNWK